jgi:5-methylcytosine-specific restriction protein A
MPGRPSSSLRGYGAAWRVLRASTPPAPCADCGKSWAASFNLDHIRARRTGGTDHPSNLVWRCHACHSRKTASRDRGFGNRPGEGTAIGVTLAGRPIDLKHPWNRTR